MIETYIGRHGEVRLSADAGSDRVTIAVSGRETTLTAANAVTVISKMREAVKRARTPAP